ncbi:MAG: DNA translocase FtsK [Ignavibacteriota bacterium]|nr:MAG: DNA translocase FtsK [Chlorobiota bacterium]MBE7476089.1 DNA translocase FtsK [Ignavibacteriales bacterium]MBL1124080.1 DNA translocase FtsK [Ignavibacteriota bacterium]MCC7094446.1 DNA translocase FtsK [Ignavibacteriaceae bacterium]MCE7856674.1 DNA translocase FtsK [Ignavibacteria bacterium CHB3]MEB2295339.1 DNA translocase FtsK [Ignavibacteria bacterium]
MTRSKRNGNGKKNNSGKNYFTFSSDKKRRIAGIFLLLFSVFIFLCIVSYSRKDEALLENSIFSGADSHNWLGIIGAHFSYFFIKSTIGYFSVVVPAIMFLWGLSIFKKIAFKTLIHTTNLLLIFGLTIASFFGVLKAGLDFLPGTKELRGNVGEYLGAWFVGLFGTAGSILFLLFVSAVVLIFAFDIKIENIFQFIKNLFASDEETKINIGKTETEADNSNLEKIKKLGKEKKKPVAVEDEDVTAEDLMDEEAEAQTQIRIIRKADTEVMEEDEIKVDERKKVDLEKTGELPTQKKNVDDDDEEKNLPDPWEENLDYELPGLDLLQPAAAEDIKVAEEELTRNAELLKDKLKLFDIEIQNISVTPGPVVTLYEIVPAPGVKISKIVGLENDIALALAARGIRIIAPIPGKGAIGVEIPNAEAAIVNARSVLGKVRDSKIQLPLALGKTISGDVYLTDLSLMPHLLIAGSTGSGKSVGINMIISSLLYSKVPADVKFILVDPKKIELSFYNKLRRHYLAVSPDIDEEIITVPQNSVLMLKSVEIEMEKRYDKLAKAGVRNIVDYNKKIDNPKTKPHDSESIKHHHLPYLCVIIDELADLMITAGREVEEPITRLAQLARAVGIHLVLATQRPSVNVITGLIKANFSSRIAYQVATKIDSRTILDMNGAEQLLGRGDMLFLPTGSPKPIRMQNAFISTDEVEAITNYVYSQPAYSKPYYLPSIYDKKKSSSSGLSADLDPMFEEAARVIVRHQQGSVSLLQRKLKLGYSRAARIVDQLEDAGIVGPNDGSKARQVLVENEEQLEAVLRSL